jgi:seryl-tRNA(Sec) selenium transferase
MARLSTEQSRQLAEQFYRLSKELGDYRFAHWDAIERSRRLSIESLEWTLLNASSDFTAGAVRVALDEVSSVLKQVSRATKAMNTAIKRAKRVEKVLGIAEAAVKLSSALVSGSPGAIAAALDRALKKAS